MPPLGQEPVKAAAEPMPAQGEVSNSVARNSKEIPLSAELRDSTRKMFSAHFDATFVATNTGQLASKAGKPG